MSVSSQVSLRSLVLVLLASKSMAHSSRLSCERRFLVLVTVIPRQETWDTVCLKETKNCFFLFSRVVRLQSCLQTCLRSKCEVRTDFMYESPEECISFILFESLLSFWRKFFDALLYFCSLNHLQELSFSASETTTEVKDFQQKTRRDTQKVFRRLFVLQWKNCVFGKEVFKSKAGALQWKNRLGF